MDREQLMALLQQNSHLNFVDRILNRDKYPSIDLGKGVTASHKMAWGEAGGKYYVYPTLVHDGKSDSLTSLGSDDAFRYAMLNKEYLEFNDPETADWVSQNYKLAWKAKGAR